MSSEAIESEHKFVPNHLNICRLCLSEELLEDIFQCDDLYLWISEFLSIIVSEDDKISCSICALCRARLNEFHDFQLRCLEVQDVLHWKSSTPFENHLLLSVAEKRKPLSESHPELTIDAGEKLQPTIPDSEDEANDDKDRLHQQIVTIKYEQKRYYNAENAYKNRKIVFSTCGENVHKPHIKDHQNKGSKAIGTAGRPFKCEHGCNNVGFHSRKLQQRHHRNVHSQNQYNCDICHKVFRVKQYLNDHKKNVHSFKTQCLICNAMLATSLGLNRHMKKIHDPNRMKQFPCPICNCSYDRKGLLQVHFKQVHPMEMLVQSKKISKMKSGANHDSLKTPKVKIEPDTDFVESQGILQDDSYAAVEGNLDLFEAEEVKIEPNFLIRPLY